MKENKERIEKRKSKGIQMAELKEIIKWGDMRRKMSIWKKSNSTTQQKFEVFNPYKEMISDDSSYFNNSNALSESEMDEPILWKHAISLVKERKWDDLKPDLNIIWERSNSIKQIQEGSRHWFTSINKNFPISPIHDVKLSEDDLTIEKFRKSLKKI